MTAPDTATVDRLTHAAGLGPVRDSLPLAGGKNNRVYRVTAEKGEAVLKQYFRHPGDSRDRLGTEWAFSRYAWAGGVRRIPEPLASDPAAGLSLFEYVNGATASPGQISEAHVEQAVAFVRELNCGRRRSRAAGLPVASEGCFSLAEHLEAVARRVARLATVHEPEVATFVEDELAPVWAEARARVQDCEIAPDRRLEATERCVSPSDFGFHNALIQGSGAVRFVDFEYAGWDDPAKLICDFSCQPAVPVSGDHLEAFREAVAAAFSDPDSVTARVKVLLPVYRLKWVCIRLNEFIPSGASRRAFALPADSLAARKRTQLYAARAALGHAQEAAV